jgi:cell wall-associated NlpC family hydrolase
MRKWLAAGVALLVVLPVFLVVMSAAILTGSAAAEACGFGGPARQVAGVKLDVEQLANAKTIVTTTGRSGMTARAAVVAVATAMQESGLRNLPHGDRDSLGLFQQRASWAAAEVRLNPVAATILFLKTLRAVPRWELLPITVASDQVQHSAFPSAVAQWETLATPLVAAYWPASIGSSALPAKSAADPSSLAASAADCPGEGGEGAGGGGLKKLPHGFALPSLAQQGRVVGFALAQLGKPYLWGGTGPDGWDCSGLTMRAWGAAGVPLPRTTFQQVLAGAPVPSTAAMRPGDLIFIAGSDGTPSNPGHVGLYIGLVNGIPYLVQAPQTGKTVEVKPVSAWRGLIVAIRRPTGHPKRPRRQRDDTHR